MSKKRSIILISIIVAFTIIFVVCSTVFRVRTQSIVFSSDDHDKISTEVVIQNSGIKKGKSIFFINKDKVSAQIEKAVPYAKVDSVEIKFPNKLIYHLSQRTDFCYALKDGIYYIFDDELKLLRTSSTIPTLIKMEDVSFSTELGDFAKNDTLSQVLGMFENKYTLTKDGITGSEFSMPNALAILKINTIKYNASDKSIIVNSTEGFSIKIVNDVKFENKVVTMMGILLNNSAAPNLSAEDRISSKVFELLSTASGLTLTEVD